MDRYSQALAAHLPVPVVDTDIYQRNAALFNCGWLNQKSLGSYTRDIEFALNLRKLAAPVHLPNQHMGRYANALKAPYLITVHDLIRYFDMRYDTRYIHRPNSRDRVFLALDYYGIRRAAAVIAVSHATKQDLARHLEIAADKVFVIYEGVDHANFRPTDRGIAAKPYVLFVGSEQPRKNLPTLLAAMRIVKRHSDYRDLRLVKVGRPGGEGAFRVRTIRAVQSLDLDSSVDLVGYVPDEDLASYYSGALCLVLPSLYEGFGLPVIEAMACGCPVIVSDRGALPEIAGGAAIVAKPNPRNLSEALLAVLCDGALRKSLKTAGLRRAADFSWERAARETSRVYDTCGAGAR
jgi:glycosyltransferase involved in cell wall biosynthesis